MNSKQIAEAYERDGYWVAHEMFSQQECDELKAEALRLMKEEAARMNSYTKKPTVFVGVAAASPKYYKLASDRRIVSVLTAIMPDGVMFMSDKFVVKSGDQRFATPWHYDAAYWPNTRPKLSVWIALDDVTANNGTLKVVRGSHRKDFEHKHLEANQTNNEFVNQIDTTRWLPKDEVICELKRGGAIFFSDRTVHGSCENTAGLDRYAIISTYHAPVAVEEKFDENFKARHVIIPAPVPA